MSLFGTDGVRGVANVQLTPDFALRLGSAAGTWCRQTNGSRVVIGMDTRRSGSMLSSALGAGFCSAGINVTTLGVAPTPTVSFAARCGGYDLAAVVSASHNPAEDNGIKFLGPDGGKLSIDDEREIERLVGAPTSATGAAIGNIEADASWADRYALWLSEHLPGRLDGLRVAVDCANGAAYAVAPKLLGGLGAQVSCVGTQPDGDNINASCGATHPNVVSELTLANSCDIGVSFDGDADRCVFCDEAGRLINGDRFMAYWALDALKNERLEPPVVVGTVMSNMGFEAALTSHGVRFERTSVGDRNVAARMDELSAKIGGEQSGHIILREFAPTGDGMLTMIEMLRLLQAAGCKASELEPRFENWPQVMVNVHVDATDAWEKDANVSDSIQAARRKLGENGRIVVRASGTQPMVRVMVEATSSKDRDEALELIVDTLARELGGKPGRRIELTHALGD